MRTGSRLPKRIPAGTKYVLECHGGMVRRFVEFPDGRTLRLASRKAASCECLDVSLVPDLAADAPRPRRRVRALERA